MPGEPQPPEITFDTVEVDSVLLFRGHTLHTGDLSPLGLYAFVEQHEEAIVEYLELLDAAARHRSFSGPSLDRPSVYLARMAMNPDDLLTLPVLDPRVRHLSRPETIRNGHNRYCWNELKKTRFNAFAGIIHAQSVYDGIWLGVQEPPHRK